MTNSEALSLILIGAKANGAHNVRVMDTEECIGRFTLDDNNADMFEQIEGGDEEFSFTFCTDRQENGKFNRLGTVYVVIVNKEYVVYDHTDNEWTNNLIKTWN